MDQIEHHTGGCLCSAVRFRAHGQPAKPALCLGRCCQARTDSTFGLAIYAKTGQVAPLSATLNRVTNHG